MKQQSSTEAKDTSKYDYLTYNVKGGQFPICVYGWSTYPESSVLAGQAMKCFIDSFEEVEDALALYPSAKPSSQWTEPRVSLSHLPGENDPVPGGMYPDDWED